MHNLINVIDYRPGVKGSRIGFFDIVITPVGLWINDYMLHRHAPYGTYSVQAPARVQDDEGGRAIIRQDGRPVFKSIAGFLDKDDLRRFTDEVVRQITAKWGAP